VIQRVARRQNRSMSKQAKRIIAVRHKIVEGSPNLCKAGARTMAGKSLGHHLAEVNAFNAPMNQAEERRRMMDAQNSISKRTESARAATTLIGDLRDTAL